MARPALISSTILAACGLTACGGHGAPSGAATTTSASAAPVPPPPATLLEESAIAVAPSNPLGLPPVHHNLDPGRRVFTFSDQMMAAARPGATLVLSAATVAGLEGDDLIIEGHGRPSYKVHSAYAIPVPDQPRLRPGDPVLTEHGGLMKHAVVARFVKDRVAVRFTDLGTRGGEVLLLGGSGAPTPAGPSKAARFVRQVEGLAPRNYAALRQGSEWLHVLLVSASGDVDPSTRRWFALGFGGAAMIVPEADLKPIPVRYNPKIGSVVSAEWSGKMRRATVQAADEVGLFVKFERAGRPATIGWGLLMPPLEAPPLTE